MTRRADRPQPAQIEKYLQGIDYPASKDEIIRCANDNQAPADIVDILWEMPDRQYSDAVDFAKGLGKVEDRPDDKNWKQPKQG